MTGLVVLAVDDEAPALDDLVRMLGSAEAIAEVDRACDGEEALRKLTERQYDALFLDVNMPGLDGLELARILRRFAAPPPVVFVSAHETPAVAAFEVRAVDYLMKPVSRTRMDAAIARVVEAAAAPHDELAAPTVVERAAVPSPADPSRLDDSDVVPVDTARGGTRLVPRSSILYLQAHGDYVRIVTDEGRFLLRARLSDIERRWESFGFVRVHRGYVVNLRRAVEVRSKLNGTATVLFPGGGEVPIARRQVPELRRRLGR